MGKSVTAVDVVGEDPRADLQLVFDELCVPCSKLRLVHHNVQGLYSKWDELSRWTVASPDSASIFCFSEIWMKPEMTLHLPGFQSFYSHPLRRPGSHQYLPGSCLFIADVLKPKHPPVCDQIEWSLVSFNATCCFITCSQQKLAIVCVYRSPSIPMSIGLDDLGQLLSKLMHVMWFWLVLGTSGNSVSETVLNTQSCYY